MKYFFTAIIFLTLLLFPAGGAKGVDAMSLRLWSPDFSDGDNIPKKFSCDGDDISPEIDWEAEPKGTRSYALIVEDPDAPRGTFTHWVVYDIPKDFHKIERGAGNRPEIKDSIKQGSTDFGHLGYGGPCPPKGHGRHRYFFKLLALDVPTLGLQEGASKNDVKGAMKGHVISESEIVGVFKR